MASPRPPPPPPPTPPRMALDFEITVVSAKHLKNVNWRNGDLKPYAVAYIDPDRRSATKPDDCGSTRPVWNERLTLPLDTNDSSSMILTLDIFHSKPSETPKPLVGAARVPLKDLVDLDDLSSSPGIKTLELRRPSGRPQGKVRIKVALRERPLPPPPPPSLPPQEQNYQMPPPSAYYYPSPAPPPLHRDYRTFSSPPPLPHYSNPVPTSQPPPPSLQYSPYSGGYSDPYSGYYSSIGGAGGGYYSSTVPPAPLPARPVYYDRAANYSGPSAPVDYSSSPYDQQQLQQHQHQQQKAKGSRMGMGAGLAVGAVAGTLGALALEEGIRYEEEKISDRVESDIAARDDYSGYRADY